MKTKHLLLIALLFTGFCATAQVQKDKTKASKVEATAKVNLEEYKGHYASEENTYGILIYIEGEKLMGKIPQQPSIVFQHTGNNTFKAEKEGIIIIFSKDKKQLALQRKTSTENLVRK